MMPSYGNGASPMLMPPMLDPRMVEERVAKARMDTERLRRRMDTDHDTYLLEWKDKRWDDPGAKMPKDMRKYVSNEPRAFADRIVAILSSARMIPRVPYGANIEGRRLFGEMKEKFFIGALRDADKGLTDLIQPGLQQSLAWYICLRGWYAGRAMLVKGEDGTTRVDVSPFDPINTYFGMGRGGLAWVAHVTRRTREEMSEEFGQLPAPVSQAVSVEAGIEVIDYYDRETNGVMADGQWVKPPTPHMAGRVPCFIGAVGPAPMVSRSEFGGGGQDGLEHWGESVYGGLRHQYDILNQVISSRLTLVDRSLNPGYVLNSQGGRKTLAESPYGEGAEVSLDVNEKVTPLELLSMAPDTDPLTAQVLGEIQRGSLPHTTYGATPFAMSGFAISLLNEGLGLVVHERVKAMEAAYRTIGRILCYQYASGMYAPVEVMGTAGRTPFREIIQPEQVQQADDLEVSFVAKLPKDEPGMYQMAEMALRVGLLSRRTVQDEILKLQNVDEEHDIILEEKAEMASPVAMLITLIEACLKRGQMELAQVYTQDLEMLILGMGGGFGPPQAGGPGGAGKGLSPGPGMPPPPQSTGPGGPDGGAPSGEAKIDTGNQAQAGMGG